MGPSDNVGTKEGERQILPDVGHFNQLIAYFLHEMDKSK